LGRRAERQKKNDQAARVSQPSMRSQHNLGTALVQKGLLDKAIAQFKEVLRFKPDDPDAKERFHAPGVLVPE